MRESLVKIVLYLLYYIIILKTIFFSATRYLQWPMILLHVGLHARTYSYVQLSSLCKPTATRPVPVTGAPRRLDQVANIFHAMSHLVHGDLVTTDLTRKPRGQRQTLLKGLETLLLHRKLQPHRQFL